MLSFYSARVFVGIYRVALTPFGSTFSFDGIFLVRATLPEFFCSLKPRKSLW